MSTSTLDAAMLDSSQPLPVGAIVPFAQGSVPSGYLECDGSAVSRTTYSALFATIAETFGSGDGSTTFNLPTREDVAQDVSMQTQEIDGIALSTRTTSSHAHNLGYTPSNVRLVLRCVTAQDVYTVGQEVEQDLHYTASGFCGGQVSYDDTNFYLRQELAYPNLIGTGGVTFTCSAANWEYVIKYDIPVDGLESTSTVYGIKAYSAITESGDITTQDLVDAVEGSRLRVGARMTFESDPGAGWLVEDGSTYNIATYPDLGAVLGDKYGGDGVTTFAVKDSIVTTEIPGSEGTAFGDMTNDGLTNLFDDNVDTSTYKPGFTSDGYAGKYYEDAKKISGASLTSKGYASYGFVTNESGSVTLTVDVYGSDTLPTSQTDGTIIGTYSGPDVIPGLDVSCDSTTGYQYVWCAFSTDEASTLVSVAEIVFTEVSEPTYIKAYDVINETAGVATEDLATDIAANTSDIAKLKNRVKQAIVPANTTLDFTADDTPPEITDGIEVQSLTITPTASDSEIEVKCHANIGQIGGGGFVGIAVFRDSTCIFAAKRVAYQSAEHMCAGIDFIDEPNTTSAVTYSIRMGRGSASSTAYWGDSYTAQYGDAAHGGTFSLQELV